MAAGPWSRTGEAAGRGAEAKEGLAGGLQLLAERKEASGGQRETQREQTERGSVRKPALQCPGPLRKGGVGTQGPGTPSHRDPACPPPEHRPLLRMSVSARMLLAKHSGCF